MIVTKTYLERTLVDSATKPLDVEIERLRAENERLRNSLNTDSQHFTILCLREEVEILRARIAELEVENERWKATMKVAVGLVGRQGEELAALRARVDVAEVEGELREQDDIAVIAIACAALAKKNE